MKDIGEELRKLGDAAAISLGFIVIEITVFLAVALIMRAIYWCPPEEHSEESLAPAERLSQVKSALLGEKPPAARI